LKNSLVFLSNLSLVDISISSWTIKKLKSWPFFLYFSIIESKDPFMIPKLDEFFTSKWRQRKCFCPNFLLRDTICFLLQPNLHQEFLKETSFSISLSYCLFSMKETRIEKGFPLFQRFYRIKSKTINMKAKTRKEQV